MIGSALEAARDVVGLVVGSGLKYAAPAVAGLAAGGPAGAALAVSGQVAAGLEKRRSKRAGTRIHKATAPAAALGAPALVAGLVAAAGGSDLVPTLHGLCAGGAELSAAGTGLVLGLFALVGHQLGHGVQDATRRG